MKYRVIWMIDIEASNPKEAAEEALKIQKNVDSKALTFDVYIPPKYPEVEPRMVTIDLNKER